MELILNSKFEYLNENELENIDGGVGVAVLYLTGKAALPYVAAGVKFAVICQHFFGHIFTEQFI